MGSKYFFAGYCSEVVQTAALKAQTVHGNNMDGFGFSEEAFLLSFLSYFQLLFFCWLIYLHFSQNILPVLEIRVDAKGHYAFKVSLSLLNV